MWGEFWVCEQRQKPCWGSCDQGGLWPIKKWGHGLAEETSAVSLSLLCSAEFYIFFNLDYEMISPYKNKRKPFRNTVIKCAHPNWTQLILNLRLISSLAVGPITRQCATYARNRLQWKKLQEKWGWSCFKLMLTYQQKPPRLRNSTPIPEAKRVAHQQC